MTVQFGEGLSKLVRPYLVTGGRTRAHRHLAIEALVSTVSETQRLDERTTPERREISALCREVKSIAEISALLAMPLGVARVLVGDLADEGLVYVHQPASQHRPDPMLLKKVLSGLRNL